MKSCSTASNKTSFTPEKKQKHISQYIKNICTVNAPHNFTISSHEGNFASQ